MQDRAETPAGVLDLSPNVRISWVTPIVFLVTCGLSLLSYRLPFRYPHLVSATALGFSLLTWICRDRPLTRWLRLGYGLLELCAITVIVGCSNGIRSPFVMLYLVFVLECSIDYGHPGGILSASAAVASLSLTEMAAPSIADLDRLVATYPFFLLVGLLTSVLSDTMSRERSRIAAERTQREATESIAREIQQALLPRGNPSCGDWEVYWHMWPQQAVGGDFIQFLEGKDTVGCLLADVTGKGVSAALVTGSLHQMIHRYGHLAPHEALARMNRDLCDSTPSGISVSAVLLRLLPEGNILLANAGHPYPLVLRSALGTVESWLSSHMIAGWFPDTEYQSSHQHVDPGDTLLLYTDGLTDAFLESGERLEEKGVERLLQEGRHLSLQALAEHLLGPLRRGRQVDDVTILLLRRVDRRRSDARVGVSDQIRG